MGHLYRAGSVMAMSYGASSYATLASQSEGDVNADGRVDDGDFVTVVENYGFGFDRNDGRGAGMDRR